MPYMNYLLAKHIPYIPQALWEDCRSVALLCLCECAVKLDMKKISRFPDYAFNRMKDAVIKYILRERRHENITAIMEIGEGHDCNYVESGEEIVVGQQMAKTMVDMLPSRKNAREISEMLAAGYGVSEIAEELHITSNAVSKTLARLKSDLNKVADEYMYDECAKKQ